MQYHLERFIFFIEEGEYYEAHEILEELWFPIRRQKDEKTLALKGLINASVSLELYKRGRKERAVQVWQTFLKYRAFMEGEFKEARLIVERYYRKFLS